MSERFWETKTLGEMSDEEWEAVCDGCGRCCLNKLEDWDTGEIAFTAVACTLLDEWTCRCGDSANRHEKVPDCVKLTPDTENAGISVTGRVVSEDDVGPEDYEDFIIEWPVQAHPSIASEKE